MVIYQFYHEVVVDSKYIDCNGGIGINLGN